MKIRRATTADLKPLSALFEAFYREEGLAHAEAVVAQTLPQVLARDDTACLVAELDGGIVGAAAMSTSYGLEVGLYAELEDLYVLPDHRSGGIASALVEAVAAEAARRGCSDIEVVLTPHAQAKSDLRLWYARRGFENTGRTILERELSDTLKDTE